MQARASAMSDHVALCGEGLDRPTPCPTRPPQESHDEPAEPVFASGTNGHGQLTPTGGSRGSLTPPTSVRQLTPTSSSVLGADMGCGGPERVRAGGRGGLPGRRSLEAHVQHFACKGPCGAGQPEPGL
jgi:hypothetical protein